MSQPIRSFKDLRTWHVAQDLCVQIYKAVLNFPKFEQFGLTSQMQRAAVSVRSNIAEGFGRQTVREKQQFYHHSLGSLFELQTQIDLAVRLNYIDQRLGENLLHNAQDCQSYLLKLMQVNKQKFINPKSLISNPNE